MSVHSHTPVGKVNNSNSARAGLIWSIKVSVWVKTNNETDSRRPTPCFPTFALTGKGGASKEWQSKRLSYKSRAVLWMVGDRTDCHNASVCLKSLNFIYIGLGLYFLF